MGNGVPICPKCQSKNNHFVSHEIIKTEKINRMIQVRICQPCRENFIWIFEIKNLEKSNKNA
jgi:predicted nucleic-acid-binding Zn-ribbon protein